MRFIPEADFVSDDYEIVAKVDGGYLVFDDWAEYYRWTAQQ